MTESELVFTDILNCDRLSLYLNRDTVLDNDKASLVSSVLRKRINGEPIQYILGRTEFMGLEFKVTPDVFIPRPETEILVEKTIDIAVRSPRSAVRRILDIGAGSGCIAVSLAKFLPNAGIEAVDISGEALEIAGINAKSNNVNVDFMRGDLFDAAGLRPQAYGLIVSNPPYVSAMEIKKLQPEIRYEPAIALDGGKDGLDFYRRIIREAPRYLREGGCLVMEMGFNQSRAVKNIFQNSGYFEIMDIVRDYNDIDRVVVAQCRDAKFCVSTKQYL